MCLKGLDYTVTVPLAGGKQMNIVAYEEEGLTP